MREIEKAIGEASGPERVRLRGLARELRKEVKAAKISELADEFDRIHSIHRAQRVGSVHCIIKARELRPYLIAAVERGIQRELRLVGRERGMDQRAALGV